MGDKVLTYVASILTSGTNDEDTVGRFGGEEFVIALENVDQEQAVQIANRLRMTVSKRKLRSKQSETSLGNVTVSIGVATVVTNDDLDSLVLRADNAMYRAKDKGRNQVCGEFESK